MVLKTFTDDGSTLISHQASDKADAQTDKQDTAQSPAAAPESAQPACASHKAHTGAAEPAGRPDEGAMEGVERQTAKSASGSEAAAAADSADIADKVSNAAIPTSACQVTGNLNDIWPQNLSSVTRCS